MDKKFERQLGVTVKELFQYCCKELEKGNGDKHILISQDDEGNGFHDLWYSFDDDVKKYKSVIYDKYILEHLDQFITLG